MQFAVEFAIIIVIWGCSVYHNWI